MAGLGGLEFSYRQSSPWANDLRRAQSLKRRGVSSECAIDRGEFHRYDPGRLMECLSGGQ